MMLDSFISTKKSLPIIVICAGASYALWRKYCARSEKHFCKGDGASNKKDRLTELPIELSSQILSRCSIRDVASMATLSRCCRNLCLALPCLDLNWYVITDLRDHIHHTPKCEQYAQAYVKRVDQVLEMYRDQNFLSFHISCCLDIKIYGGDIDRWISFVASSKGLQSLSLQFICEDKWRDSVNSHRDELYPVSGSFLSQFSYLEYLHLDTCILMLEKELKISKLTTLDLNCVILEVSQWQNVFSCSPTIKCLWLRRCKLPPKLCIGNNFPCLSFIMIVSCSGLQELEVSAWKLQRFDLHTSEELKCSFFNVPNLERVYLYPLSVRCTEDILNNLAVKVPSLKYFSLRGFHSLMHKLPSSTANLFYSVSSLRISITIDDGDILYGLPCLLKSFPQLKSLEMKLPEDSCYKMDGFPVLHAHTQLEYVEIFVLQVEYLPIAVYLLESASVLKRMVVTKDSKGLIGYENLYWAYFDQKYSSKERKVIHKSLIGKASSTNVELIIK